MHKLRDLWTRFQIDLMLEIMDARDAMNKKREK